MSTSNLQPIQVWGLGGPNPPRVAIILEQLKLPYTITALPLSEVKKPEYLAINPNGRIPAIRDPNNGNLTLWESGAILEYLIERYDTDRRLSFEPGTPESFYAKQWLFFQASGQGPYYGQLGWFKLYHHEKVPSAIARYLAEVNRVTGVLDGWLAKQDTGAGGPWLVGGKLSYADLAFVSWQGVIAHVTNKEEYDLDQYPHAKAWLEKMNKLESVSKVLKRSFEGTMKEKVVQAGKS
ncbi:glutathione S-transferase [Mytilinidion resinicola]|uniref:Glutathione S-transferase n=1 Tax=Mytilinidion resinicola TaxID=574789 RepID=A0A6A6Z8Z7_9PEZI|nr:glutathione S-transferase [Mytilinidion resinicola]KAF2817278.1 glutathione S-transferase [Mytilinidion resinicola]